MSAVRPHRTFFFALCALIAPTISAQSILTYAGGGTRDGLQAKSIVLTSPYGLAADTKGTTDACGASMERPA
jgi:hypothetical protein